MNPKETSPEGMLDQLIGEIRDERIDDARVQESGRRVWDRIQQKSAGSGRLASCNDFQALIPSYREGTLAPGRRMLLEDHAHQCVVCRKVLFGETEAPPKVIEMPARRMTRSRWIAIAASVTVALIAGRWAYEQFAPAPAGSRATVQLADGGVFRLEKGTLQPVSAGVELRDGEVLRTSAGSHAVVKLADQSLVEVGERAEFRVSAARRDMTVHLNQGAVIIQAAKRRSGHLYVATGDSRVAVTGTVFSVNRGAKGTRVSVVEGEVVVERGHSEKILHAGDQLSTHRSMEAVPIKQEIAWSRNAADHLKMMQDMVAFKDSLQKVRMPGIRYSSRFLESVPANAVVFLSVPNARDALENAQTLFASELRRTGAEGADTKFTDFVGRISRFSEYLGEEFVVAGVPNGRKMTAVAIASVQRSGLRQFLETEMSKSGETKMQVKEGAEPIQARQPEELLVSIRGDRVVLGVDPAAVNGAFAGGTGFSATPFGQRIGQAFQDGTGIVLGIDLQAFVHSKTNQEKDKQISSRVGTDGLRYLIAEQRTFNDNTQNSAVLNFDGPRHGLASWLAEPGPMGGLGFVSPHAQFAASVITKNPQDIIAELFALAQAHGPDGIAKIEEIQRLTGVDLKLDIAASLGSEATFAIDGPMLPVPSWKLIVEVNQPDRLQLAIQKLVTAVNTEAQKSGGGATLTSEPISPQAKMYAIQLSGQTKVPAIYYMYSDGYLVAAPTKELVRTSIQNRASGIRLDTSGTFRQLLPRDQNANFSGLIYQNAQEALKMLSNLAPEEQAQARQLAEKIGPTLIAAYAQADRIQVTTYGSSMDLLMQTALAPMFHGGTAARQKRGTPRQVAAYR